MEIYSKKLPLPIIYKILSYVHNPQPTELLEDIVNFYNTTNLILYYYEIKYIMSNFENPMDWLNNDLISYMNSYKPTMWGYIPNFYKIILRNPFINPIQRKKYFFNRLSNNNTSIILDNSDYTYKAFIYIHRLEQFSANKGFNLLWGLLNCKEREIFIRNTIIEINYLYDID
jgi:hypothetical protein